MRCLSSRKKIEQGADRVSSAVCPTCGRKVRIDAYDYLYNHDVPKEKK